MTKPWKPSIWYREEDSSRIMVLRNKRHKLDSIEAAVPVLQIYEGLPLTAEDIEEEYIEPYGGFDENDEPIVFRGGWAYVIKREAYERLCQEAS